MILFDFTSQFCVQTINTKGRNVGKQKPGCKTIDFLYGNNNFDTYLQEPKSYYYKFYGISLFILNFF